MTDDLDARLKHKRDAIDAIDRQIVQRLNQRVRQDGGADESQVLAKITAFNPGPLSDASLQAIYRALMLAGLAPDAQPTATATVDKLDQAIVQLLSQRVQHAAEIGTIKHANGADYYDPTREAQVMAKIAQLNTGPIHTRTLHSVYREVISGSIALEKRLIIGYLGPEATYTHQAAISKFGVSLDFRAIKTIPEVFAEVGAGAADYGVIPIENSTEGAVFHSMDMLVESDLHICAQVYLPIEHCLIAYAPLDQIKEVHSKDQALGQCRTWLRQHLPEATLIDVVSTAEAVRTAQQHQQVAAVASAFCAQHYTVPIQARSIQDHDDNVTRFLVIGKTHAKPMGGGRDKTSLVISLRDECGALEKALRAFAVRGINLSKIESRPSRKKAWDYFFFIDLIGHYHDAPVQAAFADLEAHCPLVKWLGSYPNDDRGD